MENIIDVKFNIECFEDLALDSVKQFNFVVDNLNGLKEMVDSSKKIKQMDDLPKQVQEVLNSLKIEEDVFQQSRLITDRINRDLAVNLLSKLKVNVKNMTTIFQTLKTLMKMRVSYLEQKYSQDELYANYKIRTEKQDLDRKIKKYETLLNQNLEIANGFNLAYFGLEIEGEPEM